MDTGLGVNPGSATATMGRMSAPRTSRQARQAETRAELVRAARAEFSAVGFHAASLESIAAAAGFSKGAVYSNFASKAMLFLAVLDDNIHAVSGPSELAGAIAGSDDPEVDEMVRGFALASLEFIATAAREEQLKAALGERLKLLIDGYADLAASNGADASGLSRRQLGGLIAALDQGSAVLALAGADVVIPRVLEEGIRRLMRVESLGVESDAETDGAAKLHYRAVRERIAGMKQDWHIDHPSN